MKTVRLFTLMIAAMCATQLATAQLSTGLVFDLEASSKLEVAPTSLGMASIPAKASLKEYTPVPENQGGFGTCVGWGTAYGAYSTTLAYAMGIKDQRLNTYTAFDPYFVYNQIKDPATVNCGQGTQIVDALLLLMDVGAKRYHTHNLECGLLPNDAEKNLAANFRIANAYVLIDYPENVRTVEDLLKAEVDKVTPIKSAIAAGSAVPIAMLVTNSFLQARQTDIWTPTSNDLANPLRAVTGSEGNIQAHAMSVIGYDDNKYGGAFEIMNSHGNAWGNHGFIWVKYDDFSRFVYEAYAIELNNYDFADNGCIFGDCDKTYSRGVFDNGDLYEGQFNNGSLDGMGIYVWNDGEAYAGSWKNNKRTGYGTNFFKNGSSRMGYWVDDTYKGQFEYADMSKTGCISGNCESGYGIWKNNDGSTYTGYFKNGDYHGYGTYTWTNGVSLSGTWTYGSTDGFAMLQGNDGTFYLGEVEDGNENGFGLMVDNQGKYISGVWENGEFVDGDDAFNFAAGELEPRSDNQLLDMNFDLKAAAAAANSSNCTSGDCQNGIGTFRFENGLVYTGQFRHGQMNGYGTLTFPEGHRYEGLWENGSQRGMGRFSWADGSYHIGLFRDGNMHGYGIQVAGNNYLSGIWEYGQYKSKSSGFGFADAQLEEPLANFGLAQPGDPAPNGFSSKGAQPRL